MKANEFCSVIASMSFWQVGPAVRYSGAENRIRTAPPTLGQHTEEVLGQLLGYSATRLDSLKREGIIA